MGNVRFHFFMMIGLLGSVLGLVQWYVYRKGFTMLHSWWTAVFCLLLPVIFLLPHFVTGLPLGLTRFLATLGGFWLGFGDGGSHFGRLRAYQLSGQSNLMQSNGWHIKKRRLATALIIATHALLKGAGRAARPTPGRAWRAACKYRSPSQSIACA